MRLTRVDFQGFKRLAATGCNVDGKLIALIGPNEAGKSSVLEGLAWLSDGKSGELPGHLRSRVGASLTTSDWVVKARFSLEQSDLPFMTDLDTDDEMPRYYEIRKRVDGSYEAKFEPNVTRRRSSLDAAAAAIEEVKGRYPVLGDSDEDVGGLFVIVSEALEQADQSLNTNAREAFAELDEWLRRPVTPDEDENSGSSSGLIPEGDLACAELLQLALATLDTPAPAAVASERLRESRPAFVLFEEQDRQLSSTYDLTNDAILTSPPRALVNLLTLAGTDIESIVALQESGDATRLRTGLKQANKLLRERLSSTWKQAPLTLILNISDDLLEVYVDELSGGEDQTVISERSEGLREFLALLCFLRIKGTRTRPILLIDEAERHLHMDAQADLVALLSQRLEVDQVIYTTHSPGCLPADLGTGIRLVLANPSRPGTSLLRNDFWSSDTPGYNALLFGMGASAAAFSVCRAAVLAEGASDMILLPTIMRLATGLTNLGYQVAPGLASGSSVIGDVVVAARVAYLSDGDASGLEYRKRLINAGVPPDRTFILPEGKAIEDLLTSSCYLAAVNVLLYEGGYAGKAVEVADLPGDAPVAKRLQDWGVRVTQRTPSHAAVASYLVQHREKIDLTAAGTEALRILHAGFMTALGGAPVGNP